MPNHFPFLFSQAGKPFAPHIGQYPFLHQGVRCASYQLVNGERKSVMSLDYADGKVVRELKGGMVLPALAREFRDWAEEMEKSLEIVGLADKEEIERHIQFEIEWARIKQLTPEQVRAELYAAGYTEERLNAGIEKVRAMCRAACAGRDT